MKQYALLLWYAVSFLVCVVYAALAVKTAFHSGWNSSTIHTVIMAFICYTAANDQLLAFAAQLKAVTRNREFSDDHFE